MGSRPNAPCATFSRSERDANQCKHCCWTEDWHVMRDKTWEDLEHAAAYDPFLYRAVTAVRKGLLTRELALIEVALALSESNARLVDEKKQRLMMEPQSSHLHRGLW
jgi:hypothetical protein